MATLILNHLERFAAPLDEGAIVVIEEARIRVRPLPIILPEDRPEGS